MKRIYLEPNQVPDILRGQCGYSGRKFAAQVTDEVTFTNTNWDGGSRHRYTAVNLANGKTGRTFGGSDMPAPWNNPIEGKTVKIPAGVVVVEHSYFCGKDMGLTFYVHPENSAKLLPASDKELPRDLKIVCTATRCYKNSYGGRKGIRFDEARRATGITKDRWDAAFADCIARGLLRKNGSVTPAGRNAAAWSLREMKDES